MVKCTTSSHITLITKHVYLNRIVMLEWLVGIITLFFIIGGIYLVLILHATWKLIYNAIRSRSVKEYPCCKYNHMRKDMEWMATYVCLSDGPGKKVAWQLPILPYTREQLEEMVCQGDAVFLYRDKQWCWIDQVDLTNMCVRLTPYDSKYMIHIRLNDRLFFKPASEFERKKFGYGG